MKNRYPKHGTCQCTSVSLHVYACAQDGMQVTHMRPWELGNHEDGLIIGIDNIIQTFNKDRNAAQVTVDLGASAPAP